MIGIYSNLYYPTRWVPLKRRGLGWQRCNKIYEKCSCIASCGLLEGRTLEIVLDIKGCNMNCRACWGWKMRISDGIAKSPKEVAFDILCRASKVIEDRLVAKSKYRLGAIRITGNEPALQWRHVMELVKILSCEEKLLEICDFGDDVVKIVARSKIIIETNGTLFGLGKVDVSTLEMISDAVVDIDVSFKGVNPEQFVWLADMPKKYFEYQISGFVKLFDFVERNSFDKIRVNPVLGLNHSPGYCVWRGNRKYMMDVEIVDREGNKIDFENFSREFEEEVLSRRELRFDEAPFREYFGINKERARQVVAIVYNGKRYLHVLPSEIPEIVS